MSNVATGHATILRIAALFGLGSNSESTTEEDDTASDSGATRSSEAAAVHSTNGYHNERPPPHEHSQHHHSGPHLSIDLHDCRILWKFQQAASAGCHMPAALHDFLLLHEDIATLELPHFYLQLPLLMEASSSSRGPHPSEASMQTAVSAAPSSSGASTPGTHTPSSAGGGGGGGSTPRDSNSTGGGPLPSPGSKVIFARGLCLNVATVGYPGRPVLPLLQVPLLTLGPSSDSIIIGTGLQKLQLSVPTLDLGVHPSHFTTAAAAWQLLQQELALVARDPADVVTGR